MHAPSRSSHDLEKPTSRTASRPGRRCEAAATIWGKWELKAGGCPERTTKTAEYTTSSSPTSPPLAVPDFSRALVTFARPTSTDADSSGTGGFSG